MAAAAEATQTEPPQAKRPRTTPREVPPPNPNAELPPAPPLLSGRYFGKGTMTLRQVPFTLRNDSGRVLRMLQHDGFAILPGVVPPDGVNDMRKGTKEFIGTDALLAQTMDPVKHLEGSNEIKVIRNRDASSDVGYPERWETHTDWEGSQILVDLAQAALNKHAPELAKRWKRSEAQYTSCVLTREYTKQQRWHMDMSDWDERDKKDGLNGEWLLVFMVLYGKKSGSEGAAPDLCPFWPTKFMYGKDKPSSMIFTRPVLAPGDLVIVRSTMLHRGGGGMDRAVGFVPFPPMNEYYGGFGSPWLPAAHGMTIEEIKSAQAP